MGYASVKQNKLSYFTVQILRLLLWRETGGFELARLISSRKSFYPEELLRDRSDEGVVVCFVNARRFVRISRARNDDDVNIGIKEALTILVAN